MEQPLAPSSSTIPSSPHRPGWHADPWDREQWRWWDGTSWTALVSTRARRPVMPMWLSVPVLVAALLVVPSLWTILFQNPMVVWLSLAPVAIVLPVMMWLDRVEPEPKAALVHAFLWGATISILVAGIVNSLVSQFAGEPIAAMVSAPVIEEAMKAGGILYAVRRRQVDGAMDGIVYAGWTAVGFAVVEDIEYFTKAMADGQLATVFVLRGILAPFAHPLFTAWIGLAVGRAVARGRGVFPAILWGYALAVASHALWNGSATAAQLLGETGVEILLYTVVAFVLLFFTFGFALYRVRRNEQRRYVALVPWLAQRYGISTEEVALFGELESILKARRRLPKAQRPAFDRVHAALARLAALHDRPGGADPATEQALVAQLHQARYGVER